MIFPKYFTFWKIQKDEVEADYQNKTICLLIQREKYHQTLATYNQQEKGFEEDEF